MKSQSGDGDAATGMWLETHAGRRFSLRCPRAADVCIEDIAHALAHLCRFTGHTREFYSVAQHSVLVSYACVEGLTAEDAGDAEIKRVALYGLLHDASEAYVGDHASPLKRMVPELRRVARRIQDAVYEAFDLPPDVPPEVHRADLELLLAEKRDLMGGVAWEGFEGVTPWPKTIRPLGTFWARKMFMKRFEELGGEVAKWRSGEAEGHGWGV